MSNPFNPFQTRSVLRFPPEAQIRPCKLFIFKHLTRSDFLYSPNLVTFGRILIQTIHRPQCLRPTSTSLRVFLDY